jgi:asparagine synthase (glutamine-hydrolysing)
MCGICGFVGSGDLTTLERMLATLEHRGPDASGTWHDVAQGLYLGHRRLSIIDLAGGTQPMWTPDGQLGIVFNGEIYNFQQLRAELEKHGHSWRGHSDTEIMLAAFVQWGIDAATQRFNGMFAFALWDKQERVLHLSRDRLGEKPLYYGWVGDTFVFCSELKSLDGFPGFTATIDRASLTSLLRFNYIPDPWCIYQGLHKLPPATLLTLRAPTDRPTPRHYWSLRSVITHGTQNPFTGTETEAIDVFESLLKHAIGQRMIADVPLGAFLTGGVDSSLIVALMQAQSTRPVRTFTIGFHEKEHNEEGKRKNLRPRQCA